MKIYFPSNFSEKIFKVYIFCNLKEYLNFYVTLRVIYFPSWKMNIFHLALYIDYL